MNLLCIGDSITWGAWDSRGGWVDRIRTRIDEMFLNDELNDYLVTYNLGVSGDTSTDVLRRIDVELDARGRSERNIAGAVVAIGTNDASWRNSLGGNAVPETNFVENLEMLLQKVRDATDFVVIVGLPAVNEAKTHPYSRNSDYESSNADIARYEKAARSVAEKLSLTFVPIFDDFSSSDPVSMLHPDGLHPNDKGHEFIAAAIWARLQPMIDSFRLQSN